MLHTYVDTRRHATALEGSRVPLGHRQLKLRALGGGASRCPVRTGAWTAGLGAQGEAGGPGGTLSPGETAGRPLLAWCLVRWSVDAALASSLDRQGPVLV